MVCDRNQGLLQKIYAVITKFSPVNVSMRFLQGCCAVPCCYACAFFAEESVASLQNGGSQKHTNDYITPEFDEQKVSSKVPKL